EPPAEAPAAVEEPAEEPAAEEAPAPEAEAAAEPAAAEAPAAEPAAAETPVAEPAPPKPAKKRLPRGLRRQRPKPKRETAPTRKPITRLPKPESEPGRRQERRGIVVSDK